MEIRTEDEGRGKWSKWRGGRGAIRPWVLGTLIYEGVELEIRGRLV